MGEEGFGEDKMSSLRVQKKKKKKKKKKRGFNYMIPRCNTRAPCYFSYHGQDQGGVVSPMKNNKFFLKQCLKKEKISLRNFQDNVL